MPIPTLREILITARAYPELSRKYKESVCTGGVFLDDRAWCRIYPMPVRYMEEKVHRYDVIRAAVWQDPSADSRPESWKVAPKTIEVIDSIGTGSGRPPDWARRRELVLSRERLFPSVESLLEDQKRNGTSLGLVRPRPGAEVRITRRTKEERLLWERKRAELLAHDDLFEGTEPLPLDYMDHRPGIVFYCDDAAFRREHDCNVLDWEIYQLSRKKGWEAVRKKLESLLAPAYETLFFMGNIARHPQNFTIVGLWYPKRRIQPRLF